VTGPRRIELHPEAVREAGAAWSWYHARNPAVGRAFLEEIDRAIQAIGEAPDRWPGHAAGGRKCLLRRFPFLIVFRASDTKIEILAVAHARRRPGYWRSR